MYPIPANATRIRYLESTGTQWIDTGVVPTTTLSLDCSGHFPNTVPGARFGSRASANSECFYVSGVTYDGSDRARIALGLSGTGPQLQRYTDPKPLRRFVLDAASKSASLEYADGTSVALSFSQSAFAGTYPLFLLAFNNAGTASFSITGTRLSACRIIDGSTLVRSFVPVRVGQVGYLYDRVSGQLFGNAGTGDFVLGPDTFAQGVVPTRMMVAGVRRSLPYDAEVEYLESTGTQYVDTGFSPDTTTTVDISVAAASSGTQFVFGVYTYGGTDTFAVAAASGGKWIFDRRDTYSRISSSQSVVVGAVTSIQVSANSIVVNGVTTTGTSKTIVASSRTAIVFGWNRNGSGDGMTFGSVKVYACKIYSGGVLVRSFVPVRVGSTGYLYDKVSKQLFGNAGTGSFTLGTDK